MSGSICTAILAQDGRGLAYVTIGAQAVTTLDTLGLAIISRSYLVQIDDERDSALRRAVAAESALVEARAVLSRAVGYEDEPTESIEAAARLLTLYCDAEHERARAAEQERDEARAIARCLAHAFEHDSRPPADMVRTALTYPVQP
jgi:hypothetical protein